MEGKTLLSIQFVYRQREYVEGGAGHCGVSPPAQTLVRLMVFLPLGRNAFFKMEVGGRITYHWLERG